MLVRFQIIPDAGVVNVFPRKPERETVFRRQNTLAHGQMHVPETSDSEVIPLDIRIAFPEIKVRDAVARHTAVEQQQERESFELLW